MQGVALATLSAATIDVALDVPRMRQMSLGMTAYAEELTARLPRVAPDLSFAPLVRTSALDLAEQFALPLRLRRMRPRLTHFLSVYTPAFPPQPYVLTIHDLIHLRFPEQFKKSVGPYYRTVVRAASARAARFISDDERTIEDLERYLHIAPAKVSVVPLGVNDVFREDVAPAIEPSPYFLFVGNHRSHKDLTTLFAAWEALPPEVDVDLLVTGEDDLETGFPRPQRSHGSLRFLGDVDAGRLAGFYRGAVALVHPALREGFGLPMLEAAAVGCPVIACEDAVPTVLQPFAAVFPARDVRLLGQLMARALSASAPRADTRVYARGLTWDRCAERTAEVYRVVLKEDR